MIIKVCASLLILRSIMGPDLGFHFGETWNAVNKFGTFKRAKWPVSDQILSGQIL